MQFPMLSIQTQPALLGMQTRQPDQQIRQPKAELHIEQPKANMNIRTRKGELSIDQSQAWADMGKYGAAEASRREAAKGKQAVMQAIAEKSQEGNRLMKIENSANNIASITKQKYAPDIRPAALDFIPSRFSVKTSYRPSELTIDVTPQKPVIQAAAQKVIHAYTPGELDIYLRQQPDIQIEVYA